PQWRTAALETKRAAPVIGSQMPLRECYNQRLESLNQYGMLIRKGNKCLLNVTEKSMLTNFEIGCKESVPTANVFQSYKEHTMCMIPSETVQNNTNEVVNTTSLSNEVFQSKPRSLSECYSHHISFNGKGYSKSQWEQETERWLRLFVEPHAVVELRALR